MVYGFKRVLIVALCIGVFYISLPAPEAKAMDPVTIAILAPIVLPYAIKAAKYTAKGLARAAPGLVNAGVELLNIFRLPLGVLQIFLGWPFGLFGTGCYNFFRGLVAPFLFVWEIICLPFYFFGLATP